MKIKMARAVEMSYMVTQGRSSYGALCQNAIASFQLENKIKKLKAPCTALYIEAPYKISQFEENNYITPSIGLYIKTS